MSLADLRFLRRVAGTGAWEGLRPPPATLPALWQDLQWHAALYREDGLPWRDRAFFLSLRVLQRVAYNAGWHRGAQR